MFSFPQEEFQQFAAALQAGMEIGWLKPVIGPQYLLEKATQAHENIIHTTGSHLLFIAFPHMLVTHFVPAIVTDL